MSNGEMDIGRRLQELMGLGPGWGEMGDETPPDREGIRRLITLYEGFRRELRPPLIFPTPDGNLQFEWDSEDLLELDPDLADLTGILYASDDEVTVDLGSEDGWRILLEITGRTDRPALSHRCTRCLLERMASTARLPFFSL